MKKQEVVSQKKMLNLSCLQNYYKLSAYNAVCHFWVAQMEFGWMVNKPCSLITRITTTSFRLFIASHYTILCDVSQFILCVLQL